MNVGVDVLLISRFERVARHPRYRRVLFTAAELAEADRLGEQRAVERLAGRFCGKEAVGKLLGRGFGQGLGWRDIEVTADRWGAPQVTLHGGAARRAAESGVGRVTLTLTHQGDLAVAVALAPARARCRSRRPAGRVTHPRRPAAGAERPGPRPGTG